MAEKELKWYSIFVVLFGTILSIADPVTDILTLVEFYRADHKTWFGVGLTFIILPRFFFFLLTKELEEVGRKRTSVSLGWKHTYFSPWLQSTLSGLAETANPFFYLTKLLKVVQVQQQSYSNPVEVKAL